MPFRDCFSHLPVAVIGADGFLGRRLADRLTLGGTPVATFTRVRRFCDGAGRPAPGLRAARTVFHLATSVDVGLATVRPDLVAADHQTFLQLLDALERCEHRPTLVLASCAEAVYDPATPPPYREDSALRPATAYGAAKLRLEHELLRRIGDVRPVIVRLSNPYGPGRRERSDSGVVRHWPQEPAAGEPLRLRVDPDADRDYVYVDDVVDALTRLRTRAGFGSPARILNIGSGVPTSPALLADAVRDSLPNGTVAVERVPARPDERRNCWLDVTAAADALDWRPATPLPVGLRRTWAAGPGPQRFWTGRGG